MDNLKGMGWMTLAMLAFALTDMFIKLTVDRLPVGEVLMVFGIGGALVFGIAARAQGARLLSPMLWSGPVMARNASEIVGTVCFTLALSQIELSLLSAVIQANPLLVTLGAALFFGEKVGWRRWLAIGIGLLGVLVIIRPGVSGFEPATLWALGAVIGLAGRDLATRPIPREVSTLLLGAWGFGAVTLSGAVLLAISGGAAMPDRTEGFQLLGALLCALVAYYSITAAMRVGEVAAVTPFRYTRLVFAFTIAALVFGERPDHWTLVGAAIVIATGLYTFWREAQVRRAARS
ncbi:DMT family transporter [Roseibacterium sp. SDUM158016]|uniref:DMT family transporter n=1 Tax=Roseicyclus sediminis TaxID=2980997 RepID=UPI0021CFCBB6|nr:DMT family transporter [Roseibacterium sp. SDUM158016]MCU4653878.1 DMT family transporter [Roseibacterium sp. SDUM158016]